MLSFWIDNPTECEFKSLDQLLTSNLDFHKIDNVREFKYNNFHFTLNDDEKVFYKFIIPKKFKADILNELYLEGYSEEFIYPGYEGVCLSIKNKLKLNKLLR